MSNKCQENCTFIAHAKVQIQIYYMNSQRDSRCSEGNALFCWRAFHRSIRYRRKLCKFRMVTTIAGFICWDFLIVTTPVTSSFTLSLAMLTTQHGSSELTRICQHPFCQHIQLIPFYRARINLKIQLGLCDIYGSI